VLKYVFLKLED